MEDRFGTDIINFLPTYVEKELGKIQNFEALLCNGF